MSANDRTVALADDQTLIEPCLIDGSPGVAMIDGMGEELLTADEADAIAAALVRASAEARRQATSLDRTGLLGRAVGGRA